MKKAIWLCVAVILTAYIAAIFTPYEPRERDPGTRLSGELAVDQNPYWDIDGRKRVYLETRTLYLVPHSVTASAWSTRGELYVGCRSCEGKYWPENVKRDNYLRIKLDGQLYERRAVRLDPAEMQRLVGKYEEGYVVFRMDPVS